MNLSSNYTPKRKLRNPRHQEQVTMAGIEVTHIPAVTWPGTNEIIEPDTRYGDYLITGGVIAPIRVTKCVLTPRAKVTDRHLVWHWIDVTHTIADLTNHETVVRSLAIQDGVLDADEIEVLHAA